MSAMKAGVSRNTARKYLRQADPSRQEKQPHDWRTRKDPLEAVWSAAEGFLADIEKYFEAALAGWTVFRLSERQLTLESVGRIVRFVKNAECVSEIELLKLREPAKA